jgi:hypothetical protein
LLSKIKGNRIHQFKEASQASEKAEGILEVETFVLFLNCNAPQQRNGNSLSSKTGTPIWEPE